MLFNKKLKNGIKSIPLVLSAIIFPFVSAACHMITPAGYTVGEGFETYYLNVKFDLLQYEKIENYLEIKTTFTFTPIKSEFYLYENFVLIATVGIHPTEIFPDEEKSKEISKSDVFGTIFNKTTCTYVFYVPISLFDEENKKLSTESVLFKMDLFIDHNYPYFYIDYFNLYE